MKYLRLSVIALILVASGLLGCSSSNSAPENFSIVKDDDPEMIAAIAKARQSLPKFWQTFDKHDASYSSFSLKVKITDNQGTEHFWATDLKRNAGKISGVINNDAEIVRSVKLGDRITIPEADISDWMYMRNGKMYGNETLRPLLKTIPPDEAAKLREMLAHP